MLDQKLILAVVCFSIILTGSIVGQQTNQADQNNLRQQNSQNSQIDPGLIPPGRESEAARSQPESQLEHLSLLSLPLTRWHLSGPKQ